MRRAVLATLFVGACGFSPGTPADSPDAGNHAGGSDGGAPMIGQCHDGATDPDLRLCLDFEDTPFGAVAVDRSAGHHDASVVNAQAMQRAVGQQAVLENWSSAITVPPALDLTLLGPLSMELWVAPKGPAPQGDFSWMIDNYDYYGITIDDQGRPGCWIGGSTHPAPVSIADNAWHYLACTYDPADGTVRIYVGGVLSSCNQISQPRPAVPSTLHFGEQYVGGIDDVHVYARALSGDEICTDAGGPCSKDCPSSD